jgi:N-acyl amino acid synthase of PEP-CTERM/exosortase system
VLDDDLRRVVYRIRHAVYCEELGYEAVRNDGLEFDDFDAHSIHCVLQAKEGGEYVGCVRLVLVRPDDPPLPFETLCGQSIDRSIVDLQTLDRTKIAEVSRLAVISEYRRRRGEQNQPVGIDESDFGSTERPRFPYIAVGLYLGMLVLARRHSIETVFMLTEQRLARQLSRLGVNLERIGTPIEHRGQRYPSRMSVPHVIENLKAFLRPMFDVIAAEIETAYAERARKLTPASSDSPS